MKLTPAQVVMLIALLAVLSFMIQFAIAKWRYEKKRKRLMEEEKNRKSAPPPPPPAAP
jgi:hypothetical protein